MADSIVFPFVAECIADDKRTPLELRKQVTVLQLSGEIYCEYEIYVDISWNHKALAIPLVQLKPRGVDEDTEEAIED